MAEDWLLTLLRSEYLRKCFEHNPDENRGPQQDRLFDDKNQPISNPRHISGRTSLHFHNQQAPSANNTSRPPRLIQQLQTSTPTPNQSDADSRKPTVITGKDRASQSYPTSPESVSALLGKRSTSDQIQLSNTSRLRSSSSKTPSTRSHLEARMSSKDAEAPREKFSAVYSLGEPWKTPLTYPKMGRRQMAVEFMDLFRLDEDEFLNDNLIGFYLRYLEHHLEQTNPELAQKVYFYNSYFYERLMQTSKGQKGINYESVQKWTRNIDIFERDFVVVPVNESYHWYVVIICNLSKLSSIANNKGDEVQEDTAAPGAVDIPLEEREDEARTDRGVKESHDHPTEKTTESLSHLSLSDVDKQIDELAPSSEAVSPYLLPQPESVSKKSGRGRRKGRHSLPKYNVSAPVIMTFDSLGTPRSSTCTALRQYIVEEARNKKGWDVDGGHIKGMTAKGIPTQPNFSDCGLYLCAYLEKFVLNPAGFVRKILQREMDPNVDMPIMASEELRSRMRGFLIGLHEEQEGKATEFSIPEIGRILLAPPPRATSPGNTNVPHSPLRDDSEDELQQDQISARILNAIQASRKEAIPPRDPLVTDQSSSIAGSPVEHKSYKKRLPLKTSTFLADALAKVNNSAPTQPKSDSGTREAAITIDDDDESQPVRESVSTKDKVPIAKDDFFKRGSSKKVDIHKDDFFEHPSELKDTISASKKPIARRKPRDASLAPSSLTPSHSTSLSSLPTSLLSCESGTTSTTSGLCCNRSAFSDATCPVSCSSLSC